MISARSPQGDHTFMPMRSNLMRRICLGSALWHPKVLQSRPDCARFRVGEGRCAHSLF